MRKQAGFTLVEIVIVLGLISIIVGVSGDIIMNLVRSYGRTQASSEVEQTATLVTQKIERELKNAQVVTVPAVGNLTPTNSITFTDADGTQITYTRLPNGILQRQEGSALALPLISGMQITNDTPFKRLGSAPDVIQLNFVFEVGASAAATSPFKAKVEITQAVVVRGSY